MFLYFEKLNELLAAKSPFVQVTVVDTNGSVPQDVGAKMLVTENGLFFGTVGGGKIEARAIAEARAMLSNAVNNSGRTDSQARNRHASANTRFWDWSLHKDIGMTCGGSVKLFMEAFYMNAWRVTIFGAGHISNALLKVLTNLDCQITCYDTRKDWLDKIPDSPRLSKICSDSLVSEVTRLKSDEYVLLMTMGHSTDMPVLVRILGAEALNELPYIGVIGSEAKAVRLRKDVLAAGLSDRDVRRFRCPMGMSFGTNDPNEIAVSIVAQLLEVRDEKRLAAMSNNCEMIRMVPDVVIDGRMGSAPRTSE